MKNVAVFFGGQSVEHDISVITGVMTVNSLNGDRFCGIPVYISRAGEWFTGERLRDLDDYKKLDLKKLTKVTTVGGSNVLFAVKGKKIKPLCALSAAINCMHGERGEDGCLAGLLQMCKIPLASPPVMPSAVCMDKNFTKTVMKGLKVKTLKGVVARGTEDIPLINKELSYPVIVKPVRSGSSIGVGRADNDEQLEAALSFALRFGESAIVEPCLENFTEINCACYADADGKPIVSECERPVGRTEILTFGDKYKSGKRIFPADIDKKISDKIKATTAKIYRELCFTGVIRIDYFVLDGEVILNEINTVPGSLAYYLFGDTLKSLSSMLDKLIERALKDYSRSTTFKTEYNSGVLSALSGKGGKGKK